MKNVNNGFVQATRFCGRDAMRSPPRVELRTPHCFARIDVAQAAHARLVEQEELQWPAARTQQSGEAPCGEVWRQGIGTECPNSRQVFRCFEPLHSAEVAPVNEAERSSVQLERNVNVAPESARIKPDQLAIEPEMKYQPSALEVQQKIFSATLDALDPLAAGLSREFGSSLPFAASRRWADGNRVDDPAAANGAPSDKRPQRLRDGFDFGKFRHVRRTALRASMPGRHEVQAMDCRAFLGGVAEGRRNAAARKPLRELVAIMRAAILAGFARSDFH